MDNNDFYTFTEYMKKDENTLTASMEDYLEMIYRLSAANGFTRIVELSQALNIQPSSATKMVQRLAEKGYIKYEKYGFLMLEERGKQVGAWLLKRHTIIDNFMRMIGVKESEIMEETEKIEHMLSSDSTDCFESLLTFMMSNPDVMSRFINFKTGSA